MTMPKMMETYCLGVVITILALHHLPQYGSSSALFETLSTKCRTVITELSPCADFIKDYAAIAEESCCSGVQNVAAGIAKNRSAVVEICECLKQGLDDTTYDPAKVTSCLLNVELILISLLLILILIAPTNFSCSLYIK
ncbi:hypothetical protein SOVF_031880 [Spinacia oleracea]|nr:hypothetical protein SOVF_031880 [Spinacia oleracea]